MHCKRVSSDWVWVNAVCASGRVRWTSMIEVVHDLQKACESYVEPLVAGRGRAQPAHLWFRLLFPGSEGTHACLYACGWSGQNYYSVGCLSYTASTRTASTRTRTTFTAPFAGQPACTAGCSADALGCERKRCQAHQRCEDMSCARYPGADMRVT